MGKEYRIEVEEKCDWAETTYVWKLMLNYDELATGFRYGRRGATRAAKKAARRHAKGLPPVKPERENPEIIWYKV